MKNVDLTKFWKSPQEVRIDLYDIDNNVIGNKVTKLHTFRKNKNSIIVKDNVCYDTRNDFGSGAVVNKIKLYYENVLVGMRRFPDIHMSLGDSISITFTLYIEVVDNAFVIEISP